MPKKIDVVNGTYKLIRISGLTSKAIPEEIEAALQVADDYAGELLSTGLDVGTTQFCASSVCRWWSDNVGTECNSLFADISDTKGGCGSVTIQVVN